MFSYIPFTGKCTRNVGFNLPKSGIIWNVTVVLLLITSSVSAIIAQPTLLLSHLQTYVEGQTMFWRQLRDGHNIVLKYETTIQSFHGGQLVFSTKADYHGSKIKRLITMGLSNEGQYISPLTNSIFSKRPSSCTGYQMVGHKLTQNQTPFANTTKIRCPKIQEDTFRLKPLSI